MDGKNFRLPMQKDYWEFVLEDMALRTWLYPTPLENHSNRLTNNLKVSPQAPVPYVFKIESEATLE